MIPLSRPTLLRGAAILTAALVAAGCGGGSGQTQAGDCAVGVQAPAPSAGPSAAPATQPATAAGTTAQPTPAAAQSPADCDRVTYLTSFGLLGRDAYAVVAAELGFFAEVGIEVDIQPGAGSPNLTQVAEGGADFAAADLSGAIIYAGQGVGGFVAIAGIHQRSPAALMTVDPDIDGPHGLPGTTVYMATGAVVELLWPVYALQAGIDPEAVEIVPVDPPVLIPALANGRADAIEQFAMGVPSVQAHPADWAHVCRDDLRVRWPGCPPLVAGARPDPRTG